MLFTIAIILMAMMLHLSDAGSIWDFLKSINTRLNDVKCYYKITDKYRLNCIRKTDTRVW